MIATPSQSSSPRDSRSNSFLAKATRNEFRLFLRAHPALLALLLLSKHAKPMRRLPQVGWLVVDPDIAQDIYSDGVNFHMSGEGSIGDFLRQAVGEWMSSVLDGADHAEVRHRLRDLFAPATSRTIVDRAAGQMFPALTDCLLAGGTVDMAQYVRELVGRVTGHLVGLCPRDVIHMFPGARNSKDAYLRLFAAAESFVSLALRATASAEVQPGTIRRAKALLAMLTGGISRLFDSAEGDTVIGRCRDAGLGLEQTRGLVGLMIVAGNGTTASSLVRTVALLHDTGDQRMLLNQPELVSDATREGLRVTSAAPLVARSVVNDTVLAGQSLREGDQIKIMTWTINHLVGGFRLDRGPVAETRQIWFGGGRHFCLGANLVHAEFAATLGTLVDTGKTWHVLARRASRGQLFPAYERLDIRLA